MIARSKIQQLELRLKYPPSVENAAKFALNMVEPALEISGVNLDFSVESLELVDDILEGLRQEGYTSDEIAETLFGFGCYVGEVLVRHANGQWRNSAETPMASFASFPLLIELENGHVCNPIGKVFKRVDNGEEDNISYFYRVVTKSLSG